MLRLLIVGFIVISINVIIQAFASISISEKVVSVINNSTKKLSERKIFTILILTFFTFTLVHVIHSLIWALAFYAIPFINVDFTDFTEALYFSIVTFTTLGYGDITLNSDWKLLSGFEAINGIMLIGWTTANLFTLLQTIFKQPDKK